VLVPIRSELRLHHWRFRLKESGRERGTGLVVIAACDSHHPLGQTSSVREKRKNFHDEAGTCVMARRLYSSGSEPEYILSSASWVVAFWPAIKRVLTAVVPIAQVLLGVRRQLALRPRRVGPVG
jgi:hypothetical protein